MRACCCVTNWYTGRSGAGHASSELGRLSVDVKVVVWGSKDVNRRVAARVPINRDVIDASSLFDVIWHLLVRPTECKVRQPIRGKFWCFEERIALSHRIRNNRKGFVGRERYLESKLAIVVDILLRLKKAE